MINTFSNIDLIEIKSLLGMNFFIPSYQRGYRWNKQQVEDLLNDIDEFDSSKDGEFYCLQPLVVKEKDDFWIVIDGQQRLTTIYLILDYLGNKKEITIEYQREKHFENLKKVVFENENKKLDWKDTVSSNWKSHIYTNPQDDNIEFYHLFVAKHVIEKWFSNKPEELKENIKERLLKETKFIWYNVGDADEHELFKNLNSGKIALTNAELIKALFLNNIGEEIAGKELKQNLISEEFDQMERTLREDDVWYFLAGNQEKYSSCIDLVFDLMLDTDSNFIELKDTKDSLRTFFYFKKLILHDSEDNRITNDELIFENAKTIWKKVQIYFYTLEGWNRNEDIYNLIGYLVACNIELKVIYNEFFKIAIDKKDFIKKLKEKCKLIIRYPDHLEFKYNKDAVWKLLIQFNIAALLIKQDEKLKFSFSDFHKYNWDVEHISPQNPKDDIAFKKLLDDYKECFLPDDLKNYFSNETTLEKQLEIKRRYFAEDPDILGNLTLLRDKENRGIGNRFFFDKRAKLKEYFQSGAFIPTCSMNIFVKFYSNNPEQMLFWEEQDQTDYLESMNVVFENFYKGDKQ